MRSLGMPLTESGRSAQHNTVPGWKVTDGHDRSESTRSRREYCRARRLVVESVDSLDLRRRKLQQVSLDDLRSDIEGKIHSDNLPTRAFSTA